LSDWWYPEKGTAQAIARKLTEETGFGHLVTTEERKKRKSASKSALNRYEGTLYHVGKRAALKISVIDQENLERFLLGKFDRQKEHDVRSIAAELDSDSYLQGTVDRVAQSVGMCAPSKDASPSAALEQRLAIVLAVLETKPLLHLKDRELTREDGLVTAYDVVREAVLSPRLEVGARARCRRVAAMGAAAPACAPAAATPAQEAAGAAAAGAPAVAGTMLEHARSQLTSMGFVIASDETTSSRVLRAQREGADGEQAVEVLLVTWANSMDAFVTCRTYCIPTCVSNCDGVDYVVERAVAIARSTADCRGATDPAHEDHLLRRAYRGLEAYPKARLEPADVPRPGSETSRLLRGSEPRGAILEGDSHGLTKTVQAFLCADGGLRSPRCLQHAQKEGNACEECQHLQQVLRRSEVRCDRRRESLDALSGS